VADDEALDKLVALPQEVGATDRSLAKLEADLTAERRDRNAERFVWIVVALIAFDAPMLMHPQTSASAAWAIFSLELVLLWVVARYFGVQEVVVVIDKVLSWRPWRGA
jgi:hypothetical protein